MAKPTGFLEFSRREIRKREVSQRVGDYMEIELSHPNSLLQEQAARCMDWAFRFAIPSGVRCKMKSRNSTI